MKKFIIPVLGFAITLFFVLSPIKTFASDWTNIGLPDKSISTLSVDETNKDNIIASINGGAQVTFNGGDTWGAISFSPTVGYCSKFIRSQNNPAEIWAGCYKGLYHSLDSGRTFSRTYFSTYDITQIAILDNGTMFVTGNSMFLYRSYDGILWQQVNPVPSLRAYLTAHDNDIYVSYWGNPSGLYKSSDNGVSWKQLVGNYVYNNGFNKMIFFSNGKICATITSGGLGCSENGGYSWSGFYNNSDSGIPAKLDYTYRLAQNPDELENLFVYMTDIYDIDRRFYSIKKDDPEWTLTMPSIKIRSIAISQGTIFVSNADGGVWKNEEVAVQPRAEEKYPVIIIPGILGSWQKGGEWKLDPYFATYDNLINEFIESGYALDKDLFAFPYDWERDNEYTGILLKEKISQIKSTTGRNKVDIVAHSMGGLVARSYINSSEYSYDINKIVFLGTPHLGSAKSYPAWESGDVSFGNSPYFAIALKIIIGERAALNGYIGMNAFYNYIHERVISIGQLIPVGSYLFDGRELRSYPNNYPRNTFLENLDLNIGITRVSSIYNVISNYQRTISGFRVTASNELPIWENGKPFNYNEEGVLFDNGDGTVTTTSSTGLVGINLYTDCEHNDLPSCGIDRVFEALSIPHVKHGDIVSNLNVLIIAAHSPVDFYVQAPNGQRIGFNKATKGEFTELEEAFYSGNDLKQPEFLVIRNPQEGRYKVVTTGTGEGNYEIESVYASEEMDQTFTTVYSGNAKVNIDNIIDVDLDLATGEIKSQIEDNTPPQINLTINDKYTHWDSLDISAKVSDVESGVVSVKALIDGNEVGNNINIILDQFALGNHVVTIIAEDKAGNIGKLEKSFLLYTDRETTIKDTIYLFNNMEFKSLGAMMRLYVKLESLGRLKSEPKSCKNILKELEEEQENKQITNYGYNLLKNDLLYLIGE